MRLPLVSPIDTRDGMSSGKDDLSRNLLVEKSDSEILSTIRPGLRGVGQSTGNGNGIVEFDGELLSIYGAGLQTFTAPPRVGYGLESFYGDSYTVQPIGSDPPTMPVYPRWINQDGSVIVGHVWATDAVNRAFVWTRATGIVLIPNSTDATQSYAMWCSADGLTVYFYEVKAAGGYRIRRWTDEIGSETLIESGSNNFIVSSNGSYISFGSTLWNNGSTVTLNSPVGFYPRCVGNNGKVFGSYYSSPYNRFVICQNGETFVEAGYGVPYCCDDDGDICYGYRNVTTTRYVSAKWEVIGGLVYLNDENLDATILRSRVDQCSSDGSVAVGFRLYSGPAYRLYRYKLNEAAEYIDLYDDLGTDLLNDDSPDYLNMSRDGITIVGMAYRNPDSVVFSYSDEYGATEVWASEDAGMFKISVSDDGYMLAFTSYLNPIDIYGDNGYRWSRDLGRFRDAATAEDKFFDFAQSTL